MHSDYEVIIIGGSYSGLAAAMALGRAGRETLVIDSGKPCNRHTPHSHNFLTRDGETPAAIAAVAKQQVSHYPTVHFMDDLAIFGNKTETGFCINTASGKVLNAKKLLFATGITDILPEIEGMQQCWAKSVIHCPYCHGYEVKGQKTAILGNADAAIHYAKLLLQWTKELVIFTNGTAQFTPEDFAAFSKHNIQVIETPIDKLIQQNGQLQQITLTDGNTHNFNVMYHRPQFRQHCSIPQQLGCTLNEMGYVTVDVFQNTTVPGIYASGDCTSPMRSVANAVAEGSKAGAMINNTMAMEAF